MNKKVKEIYLSDALTQDSKHLLIIYEDNTIVMKWCCGSVVEAKERPTLTVIDKKTFIEYGQGNLFGVREKKPFKDEQGNLDEIWTKII